MDSLHASFAIKNLKSVKFTAIGPVTLPTPLSAVDLQAQYPWALTFQKNTNGVERLCVSKRLEVPLVLAYDDNGASFTVEPTPFEPVYFLDGHPTTVPIFRPR